MTEQLVHNANLVDSLGSAIRDGEHGLGTVPDLLKRVLEEESWREFVTRLGEHVEHVQFEEFVTTPPLKGLGSDVALVRRIVDDELVVLQLLDDALAQPAGERTDLSNNRREVKRGQGTSKEQALRRLRKDRPDLHGRVLDGELSPHRAMVEAGFRPRTQNVRVDDPESAARALRKHMSPDARARLVELLSKDGD